MLTSVQANPRVARLILSERQQARHESGRDPCIGIFEGCYVKPDFSAERSGLDPNTLKCRQEAENYGASDRRLLQVGGFVQRMRIDHLA
jgi:hypothetical protein